jgi:hypothetical protein
MQLIIVIQSLYKIDNICERHNSVYLPKILKFQDIHKYNFSSKCFNEYYKK